MKIIKLACLAFLLLAACSEKPGGIFVMNEETIENFFEKEKQSWNPADHLNLLIDQPVTEAELPPIPPGAVRLYGTLASDGPYKFLSKQAAIENRGSSFAESIFGKLGPAGSVGNAWFYADFDPATGRIGDARAYLYGFMGGVCDMRKKTEADFGNVSESGFKLNIMGPCLFPQMSGSTADYALLLQGTRKAGNYSVSYIIDDSAAIRAIPLHPKKSPDIYDSGKGIAWIGKSALSGTAGPGSR